MAVEMIDLVALILRWDELEGHSDACLNGHDRDDPVFRCDFCVLEDEMLAAAEALREAGKGKR